MVQRKSAEAMRPLKSENPVELDQFFVDHVEQIQLFYL